MADIFLYDVIGEDFFGEGLTGKWLRDELATAGRDEPITLRINSPGGDVMEAVTMAKLLSEHAGPVDCKIDGLAASAASYLAATIDRVAMSSGGLYMIHNPWSVVAGGSDEMRSEADLLDKITVNLAATYAAKATASGEEITEAMAAETWYTADEALAAGLIDEVTESKAKACRVPKTMGYKHQPKGGILAGEKPTDQRSPLSAEAMKRQVALARARLRGPKK